MARVCASVGLSLYLSGCGGGDIPTTTTKKIITPSPTKPTTTRATSTAATTTSTTTTTSTRAPATTTAAHACDSPYYNGTHSCFAGVIVDNKKEIICGGNNADGSPAVFPRATTLCAGQTLRFNPKEKFFCYDEMHSNSVGKCAPWKDDFDTVHCTCKTFSPVASAKDEPKAKVASAKWAEVVDTRQRPPVDEDPPCYKGEKEYGCMNGHKYNYGSQLPCGNLLIFPSKYGCCPTDGEFSAYNLQKQSCCKDGRDGSYEVKEGGHACQCTTCSGSIV